MNCSAGQAARRSAGTACREVLRPHLRSLVAVQSVLGAAEIPCIAADGPFVLANLPAIGVERVPVGLHL